MIFITQEDELKIGEGIVGLYFYASWMPYHKKMMIMISKIEEKYNNIIFYAIDTDYFKNLCKRFEVTSIPTVIIRKNDIEANRLNGIILTSAFRSAFVDICNN